MPDPNELRREWEERQRQLREEQLHEKLKWERDREETRQKDSDSSSDYPRGRPVDERPTKDEDE